MKTMFAIGVLGSGGEIGMIEKMFNNCSLIKIDDAKKISRLNAPSFNGLVVVWKA